MTAYLRAALRTAAHALADPVLRNSRCPICQCPTPATYMCLACCRAYDRSTTDGSIMGEILWAASRAIMFERRRAKAVRRG